MIKLRPLDLNDLEFRISLLNNPDISQFLNVNESFSLNKTIEWFYNRNLSKRYDCVFLYNDISIGMGGITDISVVNKNAFLYLYIDNKFQGKGLGISSMIRLCEYGFLELGLNKVYSYTFAFNHKVNKMHEKIGFKKEGILRKHTYKEGIFQDRYLYGLLKSELL